MLNAGDVVGHPGGEDAAVRAVRDSGLRVTGFQVLRDFEGLSGHLHAYKLDVAKAMLQMCRALGSSVLLACSSTSAHATGDKDSLMRDLRKLALLAVPFGIRIAYEALSWGRHVNLLAQAWDIVRDADRSNLGVCIDSYHVLAHGTGAGAAGRDRSAEGVPRAALRFPVAGDPLARGPHGDRATLPRVSRRGRAQRGCQRAGPALDDMGTAATTASRCSTTTTSSCRCRWSPSAPGAR